MESLSPQVVAAAKLPILNSNEFDLWKMRIEQYFLITDYSLWEVILNGDSPTPTRVVDDKHQLKFNIHKDAKSLMETTEKRFGRNKETKKVQKTLLKQHYENFSGSSSESLDQIHDRLQKLISQLEILGESLSQEDINLKFLRSLSSEWRTHTLIWRNKADLEDQSLDDLCNNLKIYEAKVKSSSFTSPNTQNIAFVSSQNTNNTNESVSVVPSVTAASTKVLVSALYNVDNLSDDEMDLKWQMAMLTMRARRFLQRTRRNPRANGTTSIGFDMSKVECYSCHRRGHFAREYGSPRDTRNKDTQRRNVPADEEPANYALMAFTSSSSSSSDNEVALCTKACPKAYAILQSYLDKLTVDFRKSQFDVLSYKLGLEFVEARLVVYQQNENVFEEDIKLSKLDVMLRDNALVELRRKFEKAEKERDELKHTLEKFQTSLKNLSKLLESQITDKTGLRYDNQIFTSTMFDCDELNSSESDVSVPTSPVHDSETVLNVFIVKPSPTKPTKDMSQSNRPSAPIIEDWVSDSEDESEGEPMPTQKEPSFVQPSKHVKTPRIFVKPVEHPTPAENLRKDIPKSRVHRHSWNKKACFVCKSLNHSIKDFDYYEKKMVQKPGNPQQTLKDKGGKITGKCKIKAGKLDFDDIYFVKELKFNLFSVSQMCDKKNNVLFTDTECVVFSFDFTLPDENHVLLRVPKENNMYNVDLKNIVPSEDLTYLFAKATLDESNLWHRRLGHINFKTMNKLVKGNLVRGLPSKVFENNHTCVTCKKASNIEPLVRSNLSVLSANHYKGKFDGKDDEGFLVGYFVSSNAFRVFNSRTRIVQETLHINFLENQPSVAGSGPKWLFDIDTLTQSMNYQSVVTGNQPNSSASIQQNHDACKVGKELVSTQQYVLLSLWSTSSKDPQNTDADAAFDVKENESEVHVSPSSSVKPKKHDEKATREAIGKITAVRPNSTNSTNSFNAASTPVTAVGPNLTNSTNSFSVAGPSNIAVSPNFEIGKKYSFVDPSQCPDDPNMHALEDIIYSDDKEDVGAETNFSNLKTSITVSPIPTTRVHKDYPVPQIIGNLSSSPQTRSRTRVVKEQVGLTQINDKEFHTYMFACFLSQEEPKRVHQALKDSSWIEAMQEELLQLKMQKVWVLVDLPKGFEDPDYPDKVYTVVKALYGLHQALRVWYETLANYLLKNGFQRGKIDQTMFIKKQKDKFQMSSMGELTLFLGLQVNQKDNVIFISQDKYVAGILRKFGLTDGKSASTPIDTENHLLKDPDVEDVDLHIYRSMIGVRIRTFR
nr:ribonuclease H-like domain-containing protein [Tanacetum cinerariifolium]